MKRSLYYLTSILIILTLLSSCKTKQVFVEKTLRTVDTVYMSNTKIVTLPSKTITVIENPCDSLGNIKNFQNISTHVGVTQSIIAKDGKLFIEKSTDSSVVSEKIVSKKVKIRESSEKEVTIIKARWWTSKVALGSILLNVILIVYIFRKPILRLLTPFLKPLRLALGIATK